MPGFYDDVVAKVQPPEPPKADSKGFALLEDLGDGWLVQAYRHRKHTTTEVLDPRYFFGVWKEKQLLPGTEIRCLLGEPRDARSLVLLVVEVDKVRGVVRVSKRDSQGRFVYVGSDEFDKHDKAAAAE